VHVFNRVEGAVFRSLYTSIFWFSLHFLALIGFIQNRRWGDDREPAPSGTRVARWIVVGISVLNLLFLVGTAL
jgi:hypothetical protein